jgi:hypothetical protein
LEYLDRGGIVIVLDGTITVDSVTMDDIFLPDFTKGAMARISGGYNTWHYQRPRYR